MFQQTLNSLGQFEPGTTYNIKTQIFAVVKVAKAVEYSKTSSRPGQSLLLTADNGEESWVKLTGKFDTLDQNSIGQRHEFLVWPFKPAQSTKTYLYCWIQRQVPAQGSSQPLQQAAQSTNGSQGMDISAQFVSLAERLVTAIEHIIQNSTFNQRPTQPSGDNPKWVGENPKPPEDGDIPF